MLAFLQSALTEPGDGQSAFDATAYEDLSGSSARYSASQNVRKVRFETIRTPAFQHFQHGVLGKLIGRCAIAPLPPKLRIAHLAKALQLDLASADQLSQNLSIGPR